jgi:outer membrane protein OmpA-like peptidoglycan-associated protein
MMGRAWSLLFMLCAAWGLQAQDKKAKSLYEEGRYSAVLDQYTKNYRDGLESADVRLMSSSMLKLGLVEDAMAMTQQAYMTHPGDAEIGLALAEVLIYDQQYQAAAIILQDFDEDVDVDPKALMDINQRALILAEWESRQKDYEVFSLEGFNTEQNEFSLLIRDERYIFCSSQQKEDEETQKFDKNKKYYSALFEASSDIAEHLPFAEGKFQGRFNIGPFDIIGDDLYFTYSAEDGPGMNLLQILKTSASNPQVWTAEEVIPADGEFNVAHPTISHGGQRIVFASDMPGGEGGMDLWEIIMTPKGWSEPVNLGDVVNTKKNEVFPRIIDGQLYFSSNGHPGYGDLDIFVVTDDMHREDLRNLYAPINSPYDDFGYLRTGESEGYFTSDRPGGEGGDDIYKYQKRKVVADKKFITGILEIETIPQKNVKVVLVDEDGNVVEQAFTDANGVFRFNRDPNGGTYNIRLAEEATAEKQPELFLTDAQGQKSKKLVADAFGNFTFELLALDDYFIEMMEVKDNSLFAFTLRGMVFYDEPGDVMTSIEVAMLDEKGIVQREALSTDDGIFQMQEVVPLDEYFFYAESYGQPVRLAILDDNDMIISILSPDEDGRFRYERPYEEGQFITLYNDDELMMIDKDAKIELSDILYGLDSWTLNSSAKGELDKLIDLLKQNEGLKIELSSHTDSRGDARYNEDLSQKRAREAWSYIVGHGVDPDRIEAKGKGEEQPVNSCLDGVSCTEEEHALNRRTEFRIISN